MLSVSENRHYCYSATLTVSVKTDNTVTQPCSQCQWKQTLLLLSHALKACIQTGGILTMLYNLLIVQSVYSIAHYADIVKQDTHCANSYATHSLCKQSVTQHSLCKHTVAQHPLCKHCYTLPPTVQTSVTQYHQLCKRSQQQRSESPHPWCISDGIMSLVFTCMPGESYHRWLGS